MIIFMGVAGAGKSVQGKLLAEHIGYQWLSTGEYLRANISGERREEMMQGKLLNDQEIVDILKGFFTEIKDQNKCILDGFPRTLHQAKWLLAEQDAGHVQITSVVYLKASKEIVRQRLLARGRADDTPEVLDNRFEEYERLTLPIIAWYKEQGVIVYEIDAERSVEEIRLDILAKLQLDK